MSNVFNLVSVTTKDMFDVEVTVLTNPDSIPSMRDMFTVCNLQLASRVTFVALKANKTYAESLGVQQVGSGYDYIEYNGGASRSLKYVSELDELRKVYYIYVMLLLLLVLLFFACVNVVSLVLTCIMCDVVVEFSRIDWSDIFQ